MLGHWTNNIMGEVISKITGVQNDSKRIAEDTQSESQPLKKRKMNSISKKLADSTLSYVFGNAFNLPKKPLSLDEISKIQGLQHISEETFGQKKFDGLSIGKLIMEECLGSANNLVEENEFRKPI